MTRLAKLVLTGVLTGTLALVGCGDDSSSPGTAGSGGTGGTAGTGGSEPLEACSDGPLATTGEIGIGALDCTEGIPFPLSVRFNATPVDDVAPGENTFELQLEVGISSATANLVLGLGTTGLDVSSATASINATAGDTAPEPQDIVDENAPCAFGFEQDMDAFLVTTVDMGTFTLDDGDTLELTLESLTLGAEVPGVLPVILTTEGDDANCSFVGDMPTVSFTAAAQ